jgi:DNA anti-recombination protein RmuC
MTGEELERAIEFLLQGQARAEERQDRTDQQIAELGKQIKTYADTQSQFIEIVTRSLEGLAAAQERTHREIAETNARTDRKITESNARTDRKIIESNARTDQRIAETNERIEQWVAENKTRGAEIDARLDRLAAMNAETDARLDRQAEIGARTDARLDRLAALVERNISGGNGNLEQ